MSFSGFARVGLFALLLQLAVITGVRANSSRAQETVASVPPTINLPSEEAADVFARQLIDGYHREAAQARAGETARNPLLLFHLGDAIPGPLKRVVICLERAGVPFVLESSTKEEFQRRLDGVGAEALRSPGLLNYDEGRHRQAIQALAGAKRLLKKVFGLPNGITLWVKFKRNPNLRPMELGMATLQAVTAGLSLGYSLYLGNQAGASANIPVADAFLMSWVWANAYWAAPLNQVFIQGRAVKEPSPGVFKVGPNRLFFYLSNAVRSALTNALVVGGAFGLENLLTTHSLEMNLENTAINTFARSWVDQWIAGKSPEIRPDGTILVNQTLGQWSMKKWVFVNTVWNFLYGFSKNLHLLGVPGARELYFVMGFVGGSTVLYQERHSLRRNLGNLMNTIRGVQRERCQTLLTVKSP